VAVEGEKNLFYFKNYSSWSVFVSFFQSCVLLR
jgi:hypothetical protein